jgi:hypothetical protein
MRDKSAEQREDTITSGLHDGAFLAMGRFDMERIDDGKQRRIDTRSRASSGSRSFISSVERLISANIAVTTYLRSPSRGSTPRAGDSAAETARRLVEPCSYPCRNRHRSALGSGFSGRASSSS